MYFYPTVIIEDFLKEPINVRKFALSFEYTKSALHSGTRTENLFSTHPYFADLVCTKILSSCGIPTTDYEASLYFHLTGEEFGDYGWPHVDHEHINGIIFASVLFLNFETKGLDSGTSIFKIKNFNDTRKDMDLMRQTFLDEKDNLEKKKNTFENYEETIRVGGTFNRLIAYDARRPHCGNQYFGTEKNNKRLTMLSFFRKIETSIPKNYTPIVFADVMNHI